MYSLYRSISHNKLYYDTNRSLCGNANAQFINRTTKPFSISVSPATRNTPFIKNKPLWTNSRRYVTENPIAIKEDEKTKFANQQDNLTRSIPQSNRKEEPKRKKKSTAQMISFSWAGIGNSIWNCVTQGHLKVAY
jgi:hypothetical protein